MVGNMYANIRDDIVVDLGCKYHNLHFVTKHLKIVASRPLKYNYDHKYITAHPPSQFMHDHRNYFVTH